MLNRTLPGVFRAGRLLPVLMVGALLAGVVGVSVVSAADAPPECVVSGASLPEARSSYRVACSLPRVDCDRVDGVWYCSSRVIGDRAPGGVSSEEAGSSAVGSGTLVVTVPTTAPPSTAAPTTALPTTALPTTEPPTTAAPTTPVPTTAPPATAPPTTEPPPTNPSPQPGLVSHIYPGNEGPERNPMKGWNSGWSDDRPEATVGFQYIKWSDLEPRNGEFDFDAVEDVIARSGSRDRHVILRLYCDWWGENQVSRGCPDWIYSEVGVDRIRGDNGRYITDYNDPRYLAEAEQAIEALGARYDDDPRLYAFQLGVIGFWGEWHTWGSQVGGGSYEITDVTERRILDAYRRSFDRTRLMARYPNRSILAGADDIGFHNDYFKPDNGHSAEFDESVSSGRRWLGGPIGGEVPPGLGSGDFGRLYGTSEGLDMIETGHYSTMKPTSVPGNYTDEHLRLHKRFGYNYRIAEARFPGSSGSADSVPIELDIANVGIAPFYYDWDVQFALFGSDGRPVAVVDAPVDLRRYGPGSSFTVAGSIPSQGSGAGTYRVAVRIVQPGADDAKSVPWKLDARNTYIEFANELPVIDGSWGSGNRLIGGWSVLGSTTVG